MPSSLRSRGAARTVRAVLGACALAVTVAVAGCGGSSSGDFDLRRPRRVLGVFPERLGSVASPGAAKAGGRNPSSTFCTLAKQQTLNDASKLIAGGSPAEWEAFFDKTEKQNAAILAAAPPEVKDAATVVARTASGLAAEMKRVGYDIKKVDAATLQSFNTAETAAAGKQLQEFTTAECGS